MQKYISLLLFAVLSVLPAFAARNEVVVSKLQSVLATGGLGDLNVGPYTRAGAFSLLVANKAGTTPTLDVKLQSSPAAVVGQNYVTTGTTLNELREGATTKIQLAAKFTQSGARSVKYVDLWLNKEGTLTAGKKLTLTVNTDSSGTPSATIAGTANTVDIDTEVSTTASWVRFTFPSAVDVADATVYHLVLTGDYTASPTNNVIWTSNTVASAGNQSTHNNTSWTAVTTESQMFLIQQLQFTDVTSGAYAQATTLPTFQILSFNLDGTISGHVRPYATIGGTSSPEFFTALLLNAEAR